MESSRNNVFLKEKSDKGNQLVSSQVDITNIKSSNMSSSLPNESLDSLAHNIWIINRHHEEEERAEPMEFSASEAEKNIGRWNKQESKTFLEAFHTFGDDWEKVSKCIPSRSRAQVRSHAQKHVEYLKKQEIKKLKAENNPSRKIFLITKNLNNLKKARKINQYELLLDMILVEAPQNKKIDSKAADETKKQEYVNAKEEPSVLPEDWPANSISQTPDIEIDFSDAGPLSYERDYDEGIQDDMRICEKGKFSHLFDQ